MPTNLYLRIIAGELGGRHIQSPGKGNSIRPMLDRVKEGLFDILARRLPKARVLDLCAGTGSLGLEALSRGAESVLFVESQRANVKVIHENIAELNVGERSVVVAGELPYALGRVKGAFDIIFFDPPFKSDLIDKTLPRLVANGMLKKGGVLVIQRDRRSREIKAKGFVVHRRHRIGDSELWFFHSTAGLKEKEKPAARTGDDE